MGKALEVVNQYYDLLNNKNFSGLKDLLSENMSFTGPVVQRSGANGYIDALKRLFKFHKKSQVLQQFGYSRLDSSSRWTNSRTENIL